MKTSLRIIAAHALLALIVLAIWLFALCLVANAQTNAQTNLKPILRVWSSRSCIPCVAFWRDFTSDADFRSAIESRFRVYHVNADAEPPITRQRYGVNGLPTFESGPSLNVLGYCSKAELLTLLKVDTPKETTPQSVPASAELAALESRLDTLTQALDAMQLNGQRREEMLVESIGRNSEELAAIAAWIRSRPDPVEVDKSSAEIDSLRARVDELLDRLRLPVKEATDAPRPEPKPEQGPILAWLMSFGLTVAQAAGVGGSIATGGGVGIAFAAVKLFAAWRRRRDSSPQNVPAPVVPGPTTFAAYPVDRLSAAFEFAKRELAAKYPGSVATLETLDSLVQQHLAGTATNPKAAR